MRALKCLAATSSGEGFGANKEARLHARRRSRQTTSSKLRQGESKKRGKKARETRTQGYCSCEENRGKHR